MMIRTEYQQISRKEFYAYKKRMEAAGRCDHHWSTWNNCDVWDGFIVEDCQVYQVVLKYSGSRSWRPARYTISSWLLHYSQPQLTKEEANRRFMEYVNVR